MGRPAVPPPQGWTIAKAMEKFASNSVHGRKWYAAFLHWRAREYTAGDIPDQVLDLWSEPEQKILETS